MCLAWDNATLISCGVDLCMVLNSYKERICVWYVLLIWLMVKM